MFLQLYLLCALSNPSVHLQCFSSHKWWIIQSISHSLVQKKNKNKKKNWIEMRMCVRTNRMNEENREAGHSDRWSLYHWILGIYVTEALGNDEVMKKSCLGAKQAESPCHAALCSATSRCNRFNGNGALWCVEKTWQAGLEAGWSWGQDTNETREYSAGLKSRTDWYMSQKEELNNPHKQPIPWVCTVVVFVWKG